MPQLTDIDLPRREIGEIIDVDIHLEPDVDDVARYSDKPYRDRLKNPSAYPKAPGSDWMQPRDRLDEESLLTSAERVQRLVRDELGIEYPLLNLNTGIQKLPTDDFAVHAMRAYNDYLLDRFLDDTPFHGLAELTTQSPHEAADELDRMGNEDGIVGVLISSTGPEKPLGDPRFDVMYRAAADNDLPVVFHPQSGPHFRHEFQKQNQGVTNSFGNETLSYLWSQTMTLASLVIQGVPEKFPDLDFVFLETGIAWVPYMTWRLNKEYSIQKIDAPLLTQSPEQYVRDSFYFSSHSFGLPDVPDQLAPFLDAVGSESLMFGSNYPYIDAEELDQLLGSSSGLFEADEVGGIMSGTAAEVFDIDV